MLKDEKNDHGPQALRARRICLSPERVVEDGLLLVREGRILDVGSYRLLRRSYDGEVQDLGEVTLTPGVCNAHTHMELCHCKGKTRLKEGFVPWLRSLLENNLQDCDPEILESAAKGLRASGTGHVVDIGSRNPGPVSQALEKAGLHYTLCGEAFGFTLPGDPHPPLPKPFLSLDPRQWRHVAAAGHALYSTSPEHLRKARSWSLGKGHFFSMHLAEFPEEEEMLRTGAGPLYDLMRGPVLPQKWRAPGVGPVSMAWQEGLLGPGTLAVHCVHVDAKDLRLLKESGSLVCLCPRSNAGIGVGCPDITAFLDAGIACCLGTDSLASNEDLDVWEEVRFILKKKPLGLRQALALTSGNVASLPGMGHLGSLMPGKAAFWSVLPADLEALLG
jgi:cytosine/adenosine deaminase-related metal-dependent hydrolase